MGTCISRNNGSFKVVSPSLCSSVCVCVWVCVSVSVCVCMCVSVYLNIHFMIIADNEQFWTAAMYNKESNLWIWYHESRLAQPVVQYTNWQTKSAPKPNNDQEVCTVLNVNPRTTTSDWRMTDCNKYRFYICEVSKKCL